MADHSGIDWTDATWNPLSGCSKVSEGCRNCYAMKRAYQLATHPNEKVAAAYEGVVHLVGDKAQWTNQIRLLPDRLEQPLHWSKPRLIFCNSMTDLFHPEVPAAYIRRVFDVMVAAHWHRFQVLTKRSERLAELAGQLPWPENVWMGVSCEDREHVFRLDDLRRVPARVRFVSAEPLLGPLPRLNLTGIHWLIAGAESGNGARPMDCAWAKEIKDQCVAAGVPFFFKQKATPDGRKIHLPVLDGQAWEQYPQVA